MRLWAAILDRQAGMRRMAQAYQSITLLNNMIRRWRASGDFDGWLGNAWQRAEAVERQPVSPGRQRRGGHSMKLQACLPSARPRRLLSGTLGRFSMSACLSPRSMYVMHRLRPPAEGEGRGGGALGLRLRRRLVLLCHGEPSSPGRGACAVDDPGAERDRREQQNQRHRRGSVAFTSSSRPPRVINLPDGVVEHGAWCSQPRRSGTCAAHAGAEPGTCAAAKASNASSALPEASPMPGH